MKFTIKVPQGIQPTDFTKYIMKAIVSYIEEKKLKLFSFPQPSEIFLNDNTLTFEAEVIESPHVKLCEYFKIPLVRKHKEIPIEDIDKAVSFIRDVKEKELGVLTDEKFAKELGHFNIETLKSAIRLEMFKEKEKENRLDCVEQIKDYLVKNCKVNIPKNLLEQLTENNYQQEVNRWLAQGNKLETIPRDGKKRVRENTERDTKFRLAIDAIIDKEKITGENPYLACVEK